MKTLLLLAFVSCAVAVALAEHADDSIQIELKQKHVTNDILKARQAKKLAKLGKSARTLPKYHQTLLDIPFKNDYILGDVLLGGQGPFQVALSTGQTKLWVMDSTVKNADQSTKRYDPTTSSTGKSMNKDFSDIDATVTIAGTWYTDIFQYGKAKIKAQPFGVASGLTIEDDLIFPVDGVFGINHLASYAYSSKGEPTAPIDNLLHPLIKKTITVFLDSQIAPSKGSSQGTVTLGGFDKTHCDGSTTVSFSLTYLDDYRFVSAAYGVTYDNYYSTDDTYVYFDSGVSTLQLPDEDLSGIYNEILPDYDWDNGMYTVGCDTVKTLSTIQINIDNNVVVIYPGNYVVDLDLGDNACALALGVVDKNNYANSGEGMVLGTPFFRQFCVGFDFDANQIELYGHKDT